MAAYFLISLFFFLTSLQTSISALQRSKLTTLDEPNFSLQPQTQDPTTYFQVTKPISPSRPPHCSTLILQHNFSHTYSKPPVTAPYVPPQCLHPDGRRTPPSLAVLEWSSTCRGRQFDRIFGIWLSGVELLRSCTAEPRPTGITWTVKKDITKYTSLLLEPQTLAVYLGNVVDSTYTGIYHVNVSVHFWFDDDRKVDFADLVLPVSRSLPLNDGLWFEVANSTDLQGGEVVVPRNVHRAVLEVYVSFHQSDEFWYTNPPTEYIEVNGIEGMSGNGAFREVVVSLDGSVVGVVWPFTVIYTGGVNPLLWRPITGIGSFDLPSYNIEITPFLGKILDGEKHRFGFGVTNGLDIWYVDANLHLWLDSKSKQTVGELIKHVVPEFKHTLISEFKGLDGKFDTSASREISSTGWVKSSYGKITTHFSQTLNYRNLMEFKGNGSIQIVNQTIEFNYGTYAKNRSSALYLEQVSQNFPLYMHTETTNQVNDTTSQLSNVVFGYNKKEISGGNVGFSFSSLRNSQNAEGIMQIKGNLVTSGLGSTQQAYRYEGTDGCYFRNVNSANITILHDESGDSCTMGLGYSFA